MEQGQVTVRNVTLDEAISLAILLQKNEQLADAETLYGRIFDLAPDHPKALHYFGVLAHQQGRSEEAIRLVEKSLALQPDQADWFGNLGIILQDQGKLDDAIGAYGRAISLNPNQPNVYSNLGVLLRAQGRPVEAEAAYRTAIRLDPGHVEAYTNLGTLLVGLKRFVEAAACYNKAITLKPKHPGARKLLAMAHCGLGEFDQAVKILKEWLEEEPENHIARHLLAACSGLGVPARASDGFIEETFDSFAASFDSKLAQLSYRAPALVAAMLAGSTVAPSKSLSVLDAGCGTGLCGELVAPFARRLIGVDLSRGMLVHARRKNVYDALVQAELTAFLRGCDQAFDVIVSADTLVYFGALEDVIAAAAAALRPEGSLIFTLEEATATDVEAVTDYLLKPHGRYCHTQAYVERLLAEIGLSAEVECGELRMEDGLQVSGLVVRARKPASSCVTADSRAVAAGEDMHAERMVGEHHA